MVKLGYYSWPVVGLVDGLVVDALVVGFAGVASVVRFWDFAYFWIILPRLYMALVDCLVLLDLLGLVW